LAPVKEIYTKMFYGNTLEDWLIALAIAAGSILVSRLFYLISTKVIKRIFEKLKNRFMYITTDMLEEPLAMIIVIIGFYYAQRRLTLDASIDAMTDKIVLFVVILVVTWAVARLLNDLISQFLVPIIEKSDSKLDDQLLPILRKGASILVWVLGIVIALDNVGYNVQTIIAGLGIGGLAFAFAAQETIANVFGGLTVFVDAPFRIGDRIKINGNDGWVREIGLRFAKLETLDGRRLTMPNSVFSKNVIENISSEPATRVIESLGLACNQNAATIEKALDALKKIIADDPDLEKNSTAWFKDFGDAAWNISVVLWIKKGADYAGTISRVNLSIVKTFEDTGIEFSLPTRLVIQQK
jgi:MscS family membrane protein